MPSQVKEAWSSPSKLQTRAKKRGRDLAQQRDEWLGRNKTDFAELAMGGGGTGSVAPCGTSTLLGVIRAALAGRETDATSERRVR